MCAPLPPPLSAGVLAYFWYSHVLEHIFKEQKGDKDIQTVLKKTVVDQLLWAPPITILFFTSMKLMEFTPELVWPTLQVTHSHTHASPLCVCACACNVYAFFCIRLAGMHVGCVCVSNATCKGRVGQAHRHAPLHQACGT